MNKDQKLIKNIETKFKTLMIGSIARFEDSFGYLWNHGSEPQTTNQEDFKDKWDTLRLELLDHGNYQIRLAIQDIMNYYNEQDKYEYNFIIKTNDNSCTSSIQEGR